MKFNEVQIKNLKSEVIPGTGTETVLFDVEVFLEEQKRYAVIEVWKNELYVAANVINADGNKLIAEYVDDFKCWDDIPMLMSFSVDWSYIGYGFCKLIQWAPEKANEFGGSFSHTAKRFYYDAELYNKCYEEKNGVPSKKYRNRQ
ncbi:hypothetical protein LI177_00475 [bacterium 210820-DFI.6.37]|nr:hypothetical protein [bacterium 210820-DFI.6.37]